MDPVYIVLMICMIAIFILVIIYFFNEEIYDFVIKLNSLLKPFNAKIMYRKNLREAKRDCKENAKRLKAFIRDERNRIKEEINDNIGYCYIDIIFDDNFEWLKKKGFKIIETKEKGEYKIVWGNIDERA